MGASHTWQLCDATGTALTELTTASGRSLSFKRNSYAEAQFTISHEDAAASLLLGALANTGVPRLRCYRRAAGASSGTIRFRGYLSSLQESAEELSLLTATFRSPFGVLLGDGNTTGRFLSAPQTWAPFDAGSIARSLLAIANTDDPTRLAMGPIETTKTRDRTYPAGSNIGQGIVNLTNILDGFDFYEWFPGVPDPTWILPTLPNAAFDVDVSGWTGATISRDTTTYTTPPASGKVAGGTGSAQSQFSSTFRAGVTYRVSADLRSTGVQTLDLMVGFGSDSSTRSYPLPNGTWGRYSVDWTPQTDISAAMFTLIAPILDVNIDSVSVEVLAIQPDATLNIVASQGVDNPSARFEYGPTTLANVRNLQRDTLPPANCSLVIGGNGLTSTYSDAASVTKYGKWWVKAEYSDVTEQATLDDKARAIIRPKPIKTVTFSPDAALAPVPWDDGNTGKGSFQMGDTVRLYARRGALTEDTPLRVNAFTVLVDENGQEATEIPDPSDPESDAVLRASLTAEVV